MTSDSLLRGLIAVFLNQPKEFYRSLALSRLFHLRLITGADPLLSDKSRGNGASAGQIARKLSRAVNNLRRSRKENPAARWDGFCAQPGREEHVSASPTFVREPLPRNKGPYSCKRNDSPPDT